MSAIEGWPAQGEVTAGFCVICHSHFCPHAAPALYGEREYKPPTRRTLEFAAVSAAGWSKCENEARRREEQKSSYQSTRAWTGGATHFPGLVGELVYGGMIGEEPDWTLRVAGDAGADFGDVDVKTSCFVRDPDLKIVPSELRDSVALFFALVAVDLEKRSAAYCGWAEKKEVAMAALRDYGNGGMHSINWRNLRDGIPA